MQKRRGILLCIVGPAGSGKTSLCEKLLEKAGTSLSVSISVTTRPARPAEIEGVSYYFVSNEKFEELKKADKFIESENVHGNFYGTLADTLMQAVQSGKDLLLRIDIRGAINLKRKFPDDTLIIFLTVGSRSILKQRILARGKIDEQELEQRLKTADTELAILSDRANAKMIDYVLVNHEFENTLNQLSCILEVERSRFARQVLP